MKKIPKELIQPIIKNNKEKELIQQIIKNNTETERLEKKLRKAISRSGQKMVQEICYLMRFGSKRVQENFFKFVAMGIEKRHINSFLLRNRLYHSAGAETSELVMKNVSRFYFRIRRTR